MIQNTLPENPLADWKFFTLKDALDDERPKPIYVVDGLLRLPSLSIFFGAPETYKTMLLVDMAACVAAGSPWLRAETKHDKEVERATIQSPVVICDFDEGEYETHNRVAALARARRLTEDDTSFRYISMPDPHLDASKRSHTEGLAQKLTEDGNEVDLLIIDNLRQVSGTIDENNSEMSRVMSNFRRLAEKLNAAVVLIHHQRKMRKGWKGRRGDALRGHSSIEAALDLAILAEGAEGEPLVLLTPTKRRYAPVKPFGAHFHCTRKPGGTELEEARFTGLRADSIGESGRVQRAILERLKDGRVLNQGELHHAVDAHLPIDVSLDTVREAAIALSEAGRIVRGKAAHKNAYKHYLPEHSSDE